MLKTTSSTHLGVLGFLLSLNLGSAAMALPFKVDVASLLRAGGVIEIVDAKDGKVLSTTAMTKAHSYALEFPSEGLYLLQVSLAKKIVWRENIFVLLQKPSPELLMKGSWRSKLGSMRTVLKVQDPQGAVLYGVSIRDKIFLRLKAVPRLVRVFHEDYSGLVSPAQELKFARVSEKQAKEENNNVAPEVQIDPLASDDDQSVYEPDYNGLLSGKEDKGWREKILAFGGARHMPPLNRQSNIYAWLRIMQESFSVRRSPDTYNGEKTQGFGTGLGGNFVFKDTMSLQLEIDTHGTKTQYEKGGANPPAEEQRRIHARFGALFDVLNIEHNHPNFALELGPVIGYTQVPLNKDNEGKTDFGGSIRGQWLTNSRTELQIRFMKSHSRDIDLLWIGSSYKVATVSPLFSLYNYHTEFDASDARSEFNETGVRFGIARDF